MAFELRKRCLVPRRFRLVTLLGLVTGCLALFMSPTSAFADPAFATLYPFCSVSNCADGSGPQSGAIRDPAGNLFGVTFGGGQYGGGAVYELSAAGTERVLYSFCSYCADGLLPASTLVLDVNGDLYGTTTFSSGAGGGTVFELIPNARRTKWKFALLYAFCSQPSCIDGGLPIGGLTYQGAQSGALYDGASPLYGATLYGGSGNDGVAYQLAFGFGKKKPKEKVIHSFCSKTACSDGYSPNGGLTMDGGGNLYGVTSVGGGTNSGVVFRLSPKNNGFVETVLYDFCAAANCADGQFPVGVPAMDANGNLFGTTQAGGAYGQGTVYKLAPHGRNSQESVLYSFCSGGGSCADGYDPQGVIVDAAGDLFGTTLRGGANSQGTLFEVQRTTQTVLHSFCAPTDCSDGGSPTGGLIFDESGNLFGTTQTGGSNFAGTVYELTP